MSRVLPLLLLASCFDEHVELKGEPHTTELGFRVWGYTEGEKVDEAFAVWAGIHSDLDPEYLLAVAKSYPIHSVPRVLLPSGLYGRTAYGSHIEIAAFAPGWTDFHMKRENRGGWHVLEHEWEHVLRGRFHE